MTRGLNKCLIPIPIMPIEHWQSDNVFFRASIHLRSVTIIQHGPAPSEVTSECSFLTCQIQESWNAKTYNDMNLFVRFLFSAHSTINIDFKTLTPEIWPVPLQTSTPRIQINSTPINKVALFRSDNTIVVRGRWLVLLRTLSLAQHAVKPSKESSVPLTTAKPTGSSIKLRRSPYRHGHRGSRLLHLPVIESLPSYLISQLPLLPEVRAEKGIKGKYARALTCLYDLLNISFPSYLLYISSFASK